MPLGLIHNPTKNQIYLRLKELWRAPLETHEGEITIKGRKLGLAFLFATHLLDTILIPTLHDQNISKHVGVVVRA